MFIKYFYFYCYCILLVDIIPKIFGAPEICIRNVTNRFYISSFQGKPNFCDNLFVVVWKKKKKKNFFFFCFNKFPVNYHLNLLFNNSFFNCLLKT